MALYGSEEALLSFCFGVANAYKDALASPAPQVGG